MSAYQAFLFYRVQFVEDKKIFILLLCFFKSAYALLRVLAVILQTILTKFWRKLSHVQIGRRLFDTDSTTITRKIVVVISLHLLFDYGRRSLSFCRKAIIAHS